MQVQLGAQHAACIESSQRETAGRVTTACHLMWARPFSRGQHLVVKKISKAAKLTEHAGLVGTRRTGRIADGKGVYINVLWPPYMDYLIPLDKAKQLPRVREGSAFYEPVA